MIKIIRIGIVLPFGTGAGRVQPCIGLTTEVWTTWFFFIYGPWVRVRESYHLALGLVESNCALLGINIPTFEGGKLHTPVHRNDDHNQYIYMILLIWIYLISTYFCSVTSSHWTVGRENFWGAHFILGAGTLTDTCNPSLNTIRMLNI